MVLVLRAGSSGWASRCRPFTPCKQRNSEVVEVTEMTGPSLAPDLLVMATMMKRWLLTAGLLLSLIPASGCFMSPRTAAGLGNLALATAVIAAEVAILSSHDAHYHGYGCGHHHRYHGGRTVYYYQDRWEYYEGGSWYVVVD
jgi:hypothetical protein